MASNELTELLALLDIERIDRYLFRGCSPAFPPRVYGGQVLAQALNAALRSVDDSARMPHSMHAYFLRPGNPAKQIIYEVDPIRDGRSFTTRRVVAKQDGVPIFNSSISFHLRETHFDHQAAMPDVPGPESLPDDVEHAVSPAERRAAGLKPSAIPGYAFLRRSAIRRDYDDPQPCAPVQAAWYKTADAIGDDPALHRTLLAYISDYGLVGTALYPHHVERDALLMFASLDHGIWFHRDCRVDDWLLYHIDSPSAAGGRGFSRGAFYTRDGVLVASCVQESLLRVAVSKKTKQP